MNLVHVRRILGLTAAAALMLAAFGVAPASARTPGWEFLNVEQLPSTVKVDANAGFKFTIHNGGSSNISQLYLTDTVIAAPTFFWNSRGTACQTSPDLVCSFGALNAGESIDVIVAYKVGSSDFKNTFKLDSTGTPGGKNKSHGDSLTLGLTTDVSGSADFDAGFVVDDQSYATAGNLGRNNKQTSQVDVDETLLPVTIEDGITTDPGCDVDVEPLCDNQIGEWTRLNVPGNTEYLKVTLNIWGGSVPGGTQASEIFLLHVLDNGDIEVIGDTSGEICADPNSAPSNGECVYVTKVGNNYRLVAWLLKNGTLRGGI